MKSSIHTICNSLCERKKYVNYRTILFVDVFLSVGSSFVTLLFVDNFIVDLSRFAYAVVLAGVVVISFLVFWILGVNKNIIRHASIKSIGKMGFAILLKAVLLGVVILLSDLRLFDPEQKPGYCTCRKLKH